MNAGIGNVRRLVLEWLRNEKLLGTKVIEVENTDFMESPVVTPKQTESGVEAVPTAGKSTFGRQAVPTAGRQAVPTAGKPTPQQTSEARKSRTEELEAYAETVKDCRRCPLHKWRTRLVFGEGDAESRLVFIGEAPGRREDIQGRPFVGEAGKLLTQFIKDMGWSRESVYITNIIKCRPPGNRDPQPEEMATCREYLEHQLDIIKPKVICCLGRHSTAALLGMSGSFSKIRGMVYKYKDIAVIPTYHPAALLYHPGWKDAVVADLKKIKEVLTTENTGKKNKN